MILAVYQITLTLTFIMIVHGLLLYLTIDFNGNNPKDEKFVI